MSRKIVIFASGSGSNAEQIVNYFANSGSVEVVGFFTNKSSAGIIERGNRLGIPTTIFGNEAINNGKVLDLLKEINPDLIVLAGYLKLIPKTWIEAFPKKMINIHPALLPKHGGKGMYGMNVHRAVVANGERESGITIHYVTENYDEGEPILQEKVAIVPNDSPEDVQVKVQKLEHAHFPKAIEKLLS